MLCATSLALILNSGKFLLSLIFLCLGIVASLVGWDDFFETRILTFGISQLDGGLPMVPLFSGLLLVPIALKSILQRHESKPHISILSLRERLLFLKRYLYNPSVLRGTMIGFFSGFVPGSGYTASSNLADSIEKRYCVDKTDDDQKLSRLVSAEAANNAGSISVLVPLLMFGLPIVFSEAIFMGVAEVKGFSYSYSYEWFINNWLYIVTILLIINTFNWLIAGVFFDLVLKVYDSCKHWIYHFLIAFSLFIMLYLAYNESRILLSLIVFGLSLVIGMIISHTSSKYTFVYGYFVSELIVDEVYRMIF
jgi:TctA family transporter